VFSPQPRTGSKPHRNQLAELKTSRIDLFPAVNDGEEVNEAQTHPAWPDHVKALVGAWRGEPWPGDLRSPSGQDVPREPF